MKNIFFYRAFAFLFFSIFLISCDKDYNTIGGDIVGGIPFAINGEEFDAVAYNHKIQKVQTNNLPINQLGVLDIPNFGTTKANFVTQLTLSSLSPTINTYNEADLDSVVLTVPYYSTLVETQSSGRNVYKLDSIRVSDPTLIASAPQTFSEIKLKVYRSGYSLENFDLDPQNSKKYYSNQNNLFANNKLDLLYSNDNFVPDQREYVKPKVSQSGNTFTLLKDNLSQNTGNIESRSAPKMRLHLDKEKFKTLLSKIKANSDLTQFPTQDDFKNYFRGLYFEVDKNGNPGMLMSLNFAQGDVTIYFKHNTSSTSTTKEMTSVTMNLSGNTVNAFENTDNFTVSTNAVDGADKLYLKGGPGSFALIDLFTNKTQFDAFKAKNLLVNDAAITFTVDDTGLTNHTLNAPMRVYLYDVENNKPLYDYYTDITVSTNVKYNRFVHGGILYNQNGIKKYRINITELVRRIYKQARENPTIELEDLTEKVRLGLVITENINSVSVAEIKANGIGVPNNPTDDNPVVDSHTISYSVSMTEAKKRRITITKVPMASVINAAGIILHGSKSSVPADKRMKFEINYTEIK